mgnify:CR=1 FL=1
MNEHSGLSRRKLLRTTAIGVPAAGMLAFGSTLVTATSANALEVDGYWGSETTRMYQRLAALEVVDGIVSSQPASQASANPGLTSGWDWVSDDAASGSETIKDLQQFLKVEIGDRDGLIGPSTISALQSWLGQTADGVLDGPSPAIVAFQRKLIEGNYS